jgi:hypothetical protein
MRHSWLVNAGVESIGQQQRTNNNTPSLNGTNAKQGTETTNYDSAGGPVGTRAPGKDLAANPDPTSVRRQADALMTGINITHPPRWRPPRSVQE